MNDMWIKDLLMNELKKVVEPLDIKIVELSVKENRSGLSINVVIEKDGGITIDDCERVTRLYNDRISVLEQLEIDNYRLQVSSPGLYRVFKNKEEYNIFKSREVKIILKEALETGMDLSSEKNRSLKNNPVFEGTLLGIENEIVKIRDNSNKIIEIPFNKIQKTKLNG